MNIGHLAEDLKEQRTEQCGNLGEDIFKCIEPKSRKQLYIKAAARTTVWVGQYEEMTGEIRLVT